MPMYPLVAAALVTGLLLSIPDPHQPHLLQPPTRSVELPAPSFIELPPADPEPRKTWSKEAVDVARVCVNEANFNLEVNDCAAIFFVLKYHADRRGISLSAMARKYSSSVFDPDRPRRGWVPNLRADLKRPRRWKSSWAWEGVADQKWRARLDEVEDLREGKAGNPCPYPVFHWGTPNHPTDAARIRRGIARGFWHPVDCGPTLNVFLAPGREEKVGGLL